MASIIRQPMAGTLGYLRCSSLQINFGDSSVEFLHLPGTVEIAAAVPELSIYYGDIGLGDWRVH